MRFVGELYKVELLKERHVHAVSHGMIHRCFSPAETEAAVSIEPTAVCVSETGSMRGHRRVSITSVVFTAGHSKALEIGH